MIVKHPWFGPKRFGWGWTPITWEGWLVTVLFLAVVLGTCLIFGRSPLSICVCIAATAVLVVICALTGLPPG